MPFTFNLQSLLEMRERIEDEKKRDFALGMAEHQRTLVRLKAAQDELDESLRKLRADIMRSDPRAMEDAHAEVTYLREQVRLAQVAVDNAARKLDELRVKLKEASKDKNVLEKLKERRREAYFEARRLREEEEIDDSNVIRVSNVATKKRDGENLR
jgi:flagellar FliJ protein